MTQPGKKLLAYHLTQLQNKNAQKRLEAIRELDELGDTEALEALQNVFRSDPDIEVRKAAQEVGRKLFLKQQQSSK